MTAPPLSEAEFAARLDPLGPFESRPALAVAVSGGADSLALCLLADRWARDRGGSVTALTVDHRLRPESSSEAERVGGWLAARGIAHVVLPWLGDKPASGIQAAARQARYRLLAGWCRDAGVLHLLLAHHQDDQAETLLLRLARGSGVDGLAAMAPVVALPELRLLRPLLAVAKARLVATLAGLGQDWVEDPSNASAVFQRVRLRRMLPGLAAEGLTPARLAETAARLARARQALEQATGELLARAVSLSPAGYAWLDAAALAAAPAELGLRALARLCRTVGGAGYPPRLERLERLYRALTAGDGRRRTFAGCVLAPKASRVLVCREPAAMGAPLAVGPGRTVIWDGRFRLTVSGSGEGRIDVFRPGAVSADRLAAVGPMPKAVLATLPAVFDGHGCCAVPHLGYVREEPSGLRVDRCAFVPAYPLLGPGHCLV